VIAITPARLRARVETLARFGALPAGGVTRPCWSTPHEEARAWLLAELRAAGLQAWVDPAGNVFGAAGMRGFSAEQPAVLTGSHIDTVPEGGILDGALGVLAGLEVLQTIVEATATHRLPLAVAAWSDEEGRYGSLFGSRAFCGRLDLLRVEDMVAVDGERLVDAMARAGFDARRAGEATAPAGSVAAYVELHIEQGPRLEEEGLEVGVVEGIVAISWSRLTIHGVQDHAGPTPMRIRHDALVAAAAVVTGVRRIARELGGDLVTTVGSLTVSPNIVNAIPGKVSLSIDTRDPRDEALDRARSKLDWLVRDACKHEGVPYELEHYWRVPFTPFDRAVVATVERAARASGARYRQMLSGAGHDAQYMAAIGPAGMIFVPSRGGRSHCEEEFTPMDDIEQGANTLCLAALDLAGRA
jgi:N-carbamoyl-L-amino-acid hydrolase